MNKSATAELKKLDKKISLLSQNIQYSSLYKPTNLKEEKKKFFNSNNYNPQFKYKPINKDSLLSGKEELMRLGQIKGGFICKVLERKRSKLINKAEMILNRDNQNIDCAYLWVDIDRSLEEKAIKIVKNFYADVGEAPNKKLLEKEEVIKKLKRFLKDYKADWKLVVSDEMTARSSLNGRTLKLRKDLHFTRQQLEGMIRHEIETHQFRRLNGEKQGWNIFREGTAGYLIIGEALATLNKMFDREIKHLRSVSLLYLGVLWGESFGFRKIFERFLELGVSPDQAYIHVARTKRGIKDTSQKGSFKRDLVYLQGVNKLIQFIKNNPEFNFESFYLGKIGFFEIKNVDQYNWSRKDILTPEYIHSKNYRKQILQLGEMNGL
jgi:hypothetical protein